MCQVRPGRSAPITPRPIASCIAFCSPLVAVAGGASVPLDPSAAETASVTGKCTGEEVLVAIDHVPIAVAEQERAVEVYEKKLGFSTKSGTQHANGFTRPN